MTFPRALLVACCVLVLAAPSFAQPATQPTTQSADREVGRVLGKVVTAKDVGLDPAVDYTADFDAHDAERWAAMSRVMQAFNQPLVARFIERRKIAATADERAAFLSRMRRSNEESIKRSEKVIAEAEAKLADASLEPAERDKLQKGLDLQRKVLPAMREMDAEPPDRAWGSMADQFVVSWKVQRELHRTYGGRVIFQQFGAEALDAMRKLLEDAEASGDLKVTDEGVRSLLYHYYGMKHTVVDAKTIEEPWFLDTK